MLKQKILRKLSKKDLEIWFGKRKLNKIKHQEHFVAL